MNLEIHFKDTWENRLRICLRMKLKDSVSEEDFKTQMEEMQIGIASVPSFTKEREFMLFLFQDELDISKSTGVSNIISEYAKEITIDFES